MGYPQVPPLDGVNSGPFFPQCFALFQNIAGPSPVPGFPAGEATFFSPLAQQMAVGTGSILPASQGANDASTGGSPSQSTESESTPFSNTDLKNIYHVTHSGGLPPPLGTVLGENVTRLGDGTVSEQEMVAMGNGWKLFYVNTNGDLEVHQIDPQGNDPISHLE